MVKRNATGLMSAYRGGVRTRGINASIGDAANKSRIGKGKRRLTPAEQAAFRERTQEARRAKAGAKGGAK